MEMAEGLQQRCAVWVKRCAGFRALTPQSQEGDGTQVLEGAVGDLWQLCDQGPLALPGLSILTGAVRTPGFQHGLQN